MHELSLCVSVVQLVAASAARENVSRVTKVVLEVGVAAPVDPHALSFAFPMAAADGPLAQAELVIERVPLRMQCNSCAAVFAPETSSTHQAMTLIMSPCPACGTPGAQVLQGRELRVRSFDGE